MSVPPQGPPGRPDEPRRPQGGTGGVTAGGVVAGVGVFVIINGVVGFMTTMLLLEGGPGEAFIGAVIFLALVAFGGGIALILTRRPLAKGIGIGLMIGWALMSVLSAGMCTGVNPGIYLGFDVGAYGRLLYGLNPGLYQ